MARVMYISETNGGALTRRRLKCRMSWVRFAASRGKTHCNRDKNPRNKCYDNPYVISSPPPLFLKAWAHLHFATREHLFLLSRSALVTQKSFLHVLKFVSLPRPTLQRGRCRRVKSFIINACDSPCRWLTFVPASLVANSKRV